MVSRQLLSDFSINDVTHTLHYLLKMLQNMQRVDGDQLGDGETLGPGQGAGPP